MKKQIKSKLSMLMKMLRMKRKEIRVSESDVCNDIYDNVIMMLRTRHSWALYTYYSACKTCHAV